MSDADQRKKAFTIGYLAGLCGIPLAIAPRASGKEMCLYNGVLLPKYHEATDSPHKLAIVKHETKDAYILIDSIWSHFYVDETRVLFYTDTISTTTIYTCPARGSTWTIENTEDYVEDATSEYLDGLALYYVGKPDNLIWVEEDIWHLGKQVIFMKGSEPIPASVNAYNPAAVLGCRLGYIVWSQMGKGSIEIPSGVLISSDGYILTDRNGVYLIASADAEPEAPKEPIAYLYNGIQLPALPEWDRSTYPFAYIAYKENIGYVFAVSGTERHANDLKTVRVYGNDYTRKLVDGEWVAAGGGPGFSPVWANYDICYANDLNTVILLKSDPIPVYEN